MTEQNLPTEPAISSNGVLAEVKVGVEESIECPYCDGQGWTTEHNPASAGYGEGCG